MRQEFRTVVLKDIGCHVQTKVDPKEEINFESIHLRDENTSNLGVVCVVIVGIVEKLGSQQNRGNYYSMNIEFSEKKVVPLNQSINVNEGENKAFVRARRILENSVKEKKCRVSIRRNE